MKRKKTIITATLIAAGTAVAVSACGGSSPSTAAKADQSYSNNQQKTYQANQPTPFNNWSQYRQTVIDTEQAEVHGVATTTFFYNLGTAVPIKSCASIGFPVASTAQLTNPQQSQEHGQYGDGTVTLPQEEPNGVFTGDSSGTYVVCVQKDGTKRIDYWEGNVETEGGAAHFDPASGQIVDDGGSTVVSKGHP